MPESTNIFESHLLAMGTFRCPPNSDAWSRENWTAGPLVAFPRVPVRILQAGRRGVLADPNVVTLYNDQQDYRRELLSPRGDECEWIAIKLPLLHDLLSALSPDALAAPLHPFRTAAAPSSAAAYARQRHVFSRLLSARAPDSLWVEECVVGVLADVLRVALRQRQELVALPGTQRAHYDAVEAVRLHLARHFAEALPLARLARIAHLSIYHFCRVFRALTGFSVHRYRTELRLRWALEQVGRGARDLTEVALDAGFTSHSHFTTAFARAFGCTPSEVRSLQHARRLTRNRKILKADDGHSRAF